MDAWTAFHTLMCYINVQNDPFYILLLMIKRRNQKRRETLMQPSIYSGYFYSLWLSFLVSTDRQQRVCSQTGTWQGVQIHLKLMGLLSAVEPAYPSGFSYQRRHLWEWKTWRFRSKPCLILQSSLLIERSRAHICMLYTLCIISTP